MSRQNNPKPPYPAQFRQQMIDLVATGRRPSELEQHRFDYQNTEGTWAMKA